MGKYKSLTDTWMWKLKRGRAVSFLGIHKSDLVCSVLQLYYLSDEDVPLFLTFVHFRENWDASLHNRFKEIPWLHAVHIVLQMVKSHIVLSALSYRGAGRVYLSMQRINTCDQRDHRGVSSADCWNWDEWMGTHRVHRNERGPSLVGSLDSSCRYNRFSPCLGNFSHPRTKYYFPHHTLFTLLVFIAQQPGGRRAGSPVSVSLPETSCSTNGEVPHCCGPCTSEGTEGLIFIKGERTTYLLLHVLQDGEVPHCGGTGTSEGTEGLIFIKD